MSESAALSTTVCISDPTGCLATVTSAVLEELSAYGEIARLDTSLGTVLKCALVTYFDVRCAQEAIMGYAGRAEPFPAADHDFRTVVVHMQSYTTKVGMDFSQFGEMANAAAFGDDIVVEYYDMRSAQRLCSLAGDSVTPVVPSQQAAATGTGDTSIAAALAGLDGFGTVFGGSGLQLPKEAFKTTEETVAEPEQEMGRRDTQRSVDKTPAASDRSPGGNRPIRTKISNKDYSKFDIDPNKIARGEDTRTTVMVRNLLGPRARKDFLKFLDMNGLSDRYTFFYMPCKEHRDVRAGFAFINFRTSEDVRRLFKLVEGDAWQQLKRGDASCKPLAMSYARFQGHEELAAHFSSSVVLHEQDPEKRPIFKPVGHTSGKAHNRASGDATTPTKTKKGNKKQEEGSLPAPPPGLTSPGSTPSTVAPPPGMAPISSPSSSESGGTTVEFQSVLQQGVREIQKIISRDTLTTVEDTDNSPCQSPFCTERGNEDKIISEKTAAFADTRSMPEESIGG
mmetsp:Transcript_125278/g.362469  ORF Transcript_125278/g.362469 Transcript_125278/m.362469 type:complete len:509 (-) Transcript_125278:94-1620(-)|eukprot:CAMPEP_0176026140 /NCGR_PEP_ID=MMETSP0120_2-20121206/12801_1 /TAXON_ID=160619 /ORGANISM="Kryptoperidinium foliaceum, Strain CCMP 1326" /LENGTH=508 /DNA_ID=CAMNT_0017359335 /DNA_START=65 /DNA_END=1591 /DNA_ORIENTATION=+